MDAMTYDEVVSDYGICPDTVGVPIYGVRVIDHDPVHIFRTEDVVTWLRENDSSMNNEDW